MIENKDVTLKDIGLAFILGTIGFFFGEFLFTSTSKDMNFVTQEMSFNENFTLPHSPSSTALGKQANKK